ncbi:hypothetical protein [Candidatus Cryosericum terrychapinii]|uniref:Pycsar effector protein domain-containing protein n=1 Tax=Candidatus Cryosericum terrychapinii TaxID=2290919 RepID=A0A398CVS0_9BACT|nr:hypothetical protein [Candidatus Cryosericum terrychapinii]RIE06623.1 hypothetical protein SMC7_01030 [Candidatus Cryosericum terrychapinii]
MEGGVTWKVEAAKALDIEIVQLRRGPPRVLVVGWAETDRIERYLMTKEDQYMSHCADNISARDSENEVDSKGFPLLNQLRQQNAETGFQVACDKTNRLNQAFQALESKAGTLAGFLGAILATIFGFVISRPTSTRLDGIAAVFLTGICLFMVSLLFLTLCLTTRRWSDAPGWQQFDDTDEYGRDPARYRCQQIAGMGKSWQTNSSTLTAKAGLFAHALWFMFAGMLCLAAAALLAIFTH